MLRRKLKCLKISAQRESETEARRNEIEAKRLEIENQLQIWNQKYKSVPVAAPVTLNTEELMVA